MKKCSVCGVKEIADKFTKCFSCNQIGKTASVGQQPSKVEDEDFDVEVFAVVEKAIVESLRLCKKYSIPVESKLCASIFGSAVIGLKGK